MRPTDYAESLAQIVNGLKVEEFLKFLSPILDLPDDRGIDQDLKYKFTDLIFAARDNFHKLELDPSKKTFLTDYGLAELFSPRNTTELLNLFNRQTHFSTVRSDSYVYRLFRDLQLRLSNLSILARSAVTYLVEGRLPPSVKPADMLRIVVFDTEGSGIDLHRLVAVAKAVNDLGCVVADAVGEKNHKLKIALIESGSDTELWIFGPIVVVLKDLLPKCFDFIVNRQNVNFERDLTSMDKALEVIDRIDARKRSAAITEVEANQLKETVFARVKALFRLGACSRESAGVTLELVDRRKTLIEHNRGLLENQSTNQLSLPTSDSKNEDN